MCSWGSHTEISPRPNVGRESHRIERTGSVITFVGIDEREAVCLRGTRNGRFLKPLNTVVKHC